MDEIIQESSEGFLKRRAEEEETSGWLKFFNPRIMSPLSVLGLWYLSSWITVLVTEEQILPYPHIVARVMVLETILEDVWKFFEHPPNHVKSKPPRIPAPAGMSPHTHRGDR